MITRNTTSPNFGGWRVLDSYKHLGTQGRMSLDLMDTFLEVISKDCDISLGAMPNKNLKDKYTLVTIAGNMKSSEISFLNRIKNKFSPEISISQSCTDAVSPRSLYTNVAMTKTRLMTALGISDIPFAAQLNEFQNHPAVVRAFGQFEQSFTRIPTLLEVSTDTFLGQNIAVENKKNFKLLYG